MQTLCRAGIGGIQGHDRGHKPRAWCLPLVAPTNQPVIPLVADKTYFGAPECIFLIRVPETRFRFYVTSLFSIHLQDVQDIIRYTRRRRREWNEHLLEEEEEKKKEEEEEEEEKEEEEEEEENHTAEYREQKEQK
ncbi:hypothetical protein FQA39_LY11640 [Lamprigera yunnana]|nr:hypothetical protein FQA39_LY11640 [Lamprigera yunnana]